jgi:hypothetical protein
VDENNLHTFYKDSNNNKGFLDEITKKSFYPGLTTRIHHENEINKMYSTKRIALVEQHQKILNSGSLKEKKEETDDEVRKQYNYMKYLNKIQNISMIGSTRLETPLNRREFIHNQLKLQSLFQANRIQSEQLSDKFSFIKRCIQAQ